MEFIIDIIIIKTIYVSKMLGNLVVFFISKVFSKDIFEKDSDLSGFIGMVMYFLIIVLIVFTLIKIAAR